MMVCMRMCRVLLTGVVGFALAIESSAQTQPEDLDISMEPSSVRTLSSGVWQYFKVNTSECDRYLHVELWDWDRLSGTALSAFDSIMADPMLMLRPLQAPTAAYDEGLQLNWKWSPHTLVDESGYRLLRSYHHVTLDLRGCNGTQFYAECQAGSSTTGQALCQERVDDFFVGVFNVREFLQRPLRYKIRASCHSIAPCPAPLLDSSSMPKVCSETGTCERGFLVDTTGQAPAELAQQCTETRCSCRGTWGDVGCDVAVERLVPGDRLSVNDHSVRVWNYYQVVLSTPVSAMLVELQRDRGDPVLFVKEKSQGYVSGGVPTVSDYKEFADSDGFRSRSNYHYRLLTNIGAGTYYVAVFNNDIYLRETATYRIRVQVSPSRAESPLCPLNCSYPQGVCQDIPDGISLTTSDFQCKCAEGYAGSMCEGRLESLGINKRMSGVLWPGQWIFFELDLNGASNSALSSGLFIHLSKNGGYPVLVSKKDTIPSLLDNEFIFNMEYDVTVEERFKLDPSDLSPGKFYLGIFNMDYYVHSKSEFQILVYLATDEQPVINLTMLIVIGLFCLVVLCIFMSICRRMMFNTAANQLDLRHGVDGTEMQQMGGARRPDAPAGLDPALVATFPTFLYQEDANDKEDSQCSVCLCDYEEEEELRRLPKCNHKFHITCIDQWLNNNSTCPLCRENLKPDADQAPGDSAPQSTRALEAVPVPQSESQSPVWSSVVVPVHTPSSHHAVVPMPSDSPRFPASSLPIDATDMRNDYTYDSSSHDVTVPEENNMDLSLDIMTMNMSDSDLGPPASESSNLNRPESREDMELQEGRSSQAHPACI